MLLHKKPYVKPCYRFLDLQRGPMNISLDFEQAESVGRGEESLVEQSPVLVLRICADVSEFLC